MVRARRPHRTHCAALLILAAIACHLGPGVLWAGGPGDNGKHPHRRAVLRSPTIDGVPGHGVRRKLRVGFGMALRKVHRLESCQELFARLGADGVDTLASTTYVLAGEGWRGEVCTTSNAFTTVGGDRVWLCGDFGRLSNEDAAAVILHEALHHAGLSEWPVDPKGPTPAQIDHMVAAGCGF